MTDVAAADRVLEQVKQKFGFVPNVLAEMSKSPAALRVYVEGGVALADASLSPKEQQAVQLTVSTVNECAYCQAAHSMGGKMAGIDPADIEAIKSGGLPADEGLKGAVSAARLVHEKQGWLDADDLSALEAQGIDRRRLYDVIAITGLKLISNYVNHIAHTDIDEQFKAA